MKRNEIYEELLNVVKTAYKFKIAERRPKIFEQTESFPALYLVLDKQAKELHTLN